MNSSPSHALKSDVSQKVWSGKKMNYHLRVFGCKTFVHVPKKQRVKLNAMAVECIFWDTGMSNLSIGFRILRTDG